MTQTHRTAMLRRSWLKTLPALVGLGLGLNLAGAHAQSFPTKPI